MNDTTFKTCPFCKEQIRKEAVKCRFCGEWLEQPLLSSSSQPVTQESPNIPPPAPIGKIEAISEIPTESAPAIAQTANASQKQEVSPEMTAELPAAENSREPVKLRLDDFALGEKVFRDLADERNIYPSEEIWGREFLARSDPARAIPSELLEELWLESDAAGRKPFPTKTKETKRWPIAPLILIVFWISWAAFPRAIESGTSSVKYLFLNALIYCTTPGSIFILLILGVWFGSSYGWYRSSKVAGEKRGKGTAQQLDSDFGNRLRFLNFSELVLAGTNYSESFFTSRFWKMEPKL
jgi:hypothetical protein